METVYEYENKQNLLTIKDLNVNFKTYSGTVRAVRNVNLELQEGKSLGILGESGSGKTTLALAMLSLLPGNATIEGSISLYNDEYVNDKIPKSRKARKMLDSKLRNIRWKDISMVFQGAMNSFNPVYTIGKQIAEVFTLHTDLSKDEIDKKVVEVLGLSGLTPEVKNSYPHELSGGMKQRAIISMALALDPKIVIADEPTTGLDVITQAEIIATLKKLKDSGKVKSLIIISHDIGVVSQLSDNIAVFYAGSIMEYGSTRDIYLNSKNPYTIELLKSYPSLLNAKQHVEGIPGKLPSPTNLPEGCKFADRCYMSEYQCKLKEPEKVYIDNNHYSYCYFANNIRPNPRTVRGKGIHNIGTSNIMELENLTMHFDLRSAIFSNLYNKNKKIVHAVTDANLIIHRGEIIGLVGESGSGKSTLAKMLIGILRPTSGNIKFYFDDNNYSYVNKLKNKHKDYKEFRKETQMIFQDPYDSLNPKMRVINIVAEPILGNHVSNDMEEIEKKVKIALEEADLSPAENYLYRYPHELSGGERQRVGIARATVIHSNFIIADEPTSMLDVSLRASFMNKLDTIRNSQGLTIMYISHDIASVYYLSDRIFVIYLGSIVEGGLADDIIKHPLHPYTKALIKSVPSPDPSWDPGKIDIIGEIGNSINVRPGCRFYDRCVYHENICKDTIPPIHSEGEHWYKCHFTQNQLIETTNE